MGANGPTGVLSNGATGDSIQIGGGGGPGFALERSCLYGRAAPSRTSFRTGYGNQGMGNIQDGMTTGSNNPLEGARFQLRSLRHPDQSPMAPNSFSNAPMPVTATNSGHMDYGFTAGPPNSITTACTD
ncbi:MAG: hypothetical protein IPM93_24000 [Candidatus Obscuribacter sp.]|nr:hypothetical protein [Candidatus Obscuribacter sp.]